MDTNNPIANSAAAFLGNSPVVQTPPPPIEAAPAEPVAEVPAEPVVETPVEAPVETPEAPAADPGDEQDEEEVEVPVQGDANKSILAALAGQPQATTKIHKRVEDWAKANGIAPEELVNYKQFKEQVEKEREESKTTKAELARISQTSPELRAAILKDLQGDMSWKKDIVQNGADFDYTKPADKQPKKALVDTFMPGKVTAEQWSEYESPEGDTRDKALVATMIELASEKFAGKAKEVNGAVEQMVAAQKQWSDNWNQSGEAAWNATKQRIPGATVYEQQLRQALSSPNAIMALFEEPGKPGVLRQDAYENAIMAIPEIRKAVLGGQVDKVVAKAKDAAELTALKRSPDKPAPKTTSVAKPAAQPAPATMTDLAKLFVLGNR